MSDHPVLLIDAMNLFVRSYSAYPTMSSHGYQMGGTIGFMKTMSRLIEEASPRAVYIAWEGGGSTKRRQIFAEYKLGRKPGKLNRFYGDDIPDTEENRKHQIVTLLGCLKNAPVCQVYAADCEGDDVIAYLCRVAFKDKEKIIASSDKDMYQLLDDKTRQYSLHRKIYITRETILEEFRVASHNFAIAKALCGDGGDNVPGVKGIGWKKVAKLFPFLGTDEDVLLQQVFDYCSAHERKSTLYKRILENADAVRRNWKLVYLDGGMLAANQAAKVDYAIETFEPKMDRMGLARLLHREGIGDFDFEAFFRSFHCIDGIGYRTGE
jgi:DNA polymerase-1